MESSPPIKPPRGVKPVKETSGLLMSVIRTLSASETNEQREREKAKIDAEYRKSDKRLNELVSEHDRNLTKVMQLFGAISTQVNDSLANIRKVKENLTACKTLLHCKRDELKKLWFEGLEYKYMLQLLDEIEEMNEVPNKLTTFLTNKHYLHATQLLVKAVHLGNGSLQGVEGIRELSVELDEKKQQLHVKLLEEVRYHLYVRTSQEALALRRQGSGREVGNFTSSPFQRSTELRLSNRQRSARRNLLEISQFRPEESIKFLDIEEDLDAPNPEEDFCHFVAILVRCLALLEKVPIAVETIRGQIQNELLSIIQRSTVQVNEFFAVHSNDPKSQLKQAALLELIQTIFEQFRAVAQAHATLLSHLTRTIEKYNITDVKLYDMKEFWSKVQAVVQLLLTDYLDIQNITTEPSLAIVFNENMDVSSYFSRRKPQSRKKGHLFKYEGSSSALTMNNTDTATGLHRSAKEKVLVCSPDPNNITLIFVPMMLFVDEIEQVIGVKEPGTASQLKQFISEYISKKFLGRHKGQVHEKVENAIRAADAWKATTMIDTSREAKPLLMSTAIVDKCIQESKELMQNLPLYAEKILKDIHTILVDYRDTCLAAYRGIVQPHPEDRRICSATWLKDEDINRFLKSLPNWLNLKAQQELQNRTDRRRHQLRREQTEEESPEDVRLRNLREAEILASNLGEGGINAQEIISDMSLLKRLAQLQESMEWFSVRILQFASNLRHEPSLSPNNNGSGDKPPPVTAASLQTLTSIGQDFDELANTCLLVLHLEVRVQCFHYLLAHSEYNRETQEPDPKVLELSRVLTNVDEVMSSCLHPRKCKYIFEGLGHLIAKILISSSQYMDQIDEAGIQRMCRNVFALQQTLTNITMTRELALDHAKRYFELFYLTPEEILNGIVEKGSEFSELEYMNAFQLINRSQMGKERGQVNVHLEKLSDILGEVGVTV